MTAAASQRAIPIAPTDLYHQTIRCSTSSKRTSSHESSLPWPLGVYVSALCVGDQLDADTTVMVALVFTHNVKTHQLWSRALCWSVKSLYSAECRSINICPCSLWTWPCKIPA
ncbi:hypothetical protein THAOC_35268 [Thalassiosira oceanica]|uniref:Uncharacterized protein n=1 Tax=Thalassiosira oceanica TaxID=159749 RepID=K0RHI4_THAOC|nr:hypothetical protein THAOC_35268 [Thalassiosira oceanica]|eukprot:EJK46092.1 hypothetical protein THAOC_35268 [Thalassiosira oceanica]